MVMTSLLACLFFAPVPASEDTGFGSAMDFGLNLLQLRANSVTSVRANHTRVSSRNPAEAERKLCPHEMEVQVAAQEETNFGCSGALRAQSTVQCSFWGEPHITSLFTMTDIKDLDVMYKSGHFRLAAARDGSWEIQVFNCGAYASAVAARFGKTIFESYIDSNEQIKYLVNGNPVNSLPSQIGEFFLDSTHRSMRTDEWDFRHGHSGFHSAPAHHPGTCMDDPGGQVYMDVAQDLGLKNLNLRIQAASDAVTTLATDSYSLCNVHPAGEDAAGWQWRWSDWPMRMIPSEMSLFTIGNKMCEGCNALKWVSGEENHHGNHAPAAQNHCNAQQIKDAGDVVSEVVCRNNGITMDAANDACLHLSENEQFFKDCMIDYCASGGQIIAAQEAESEEALENPQPVCVSGEECDAASDCCNALKDESMLTLDNVVKNEICNGGEVRYASALIQNGQVIDMVVKPVGDFACTGKLDESKYGARNAQIGVLSVNSGTEQAFEFSFVEHDTSNPVVPQSLMMSFLDLDQGKKGKQRESVEVCGAADAITTDDTELDVSVNGDCVKAMSTIAGTGKDNPDILEEMSQAQRARTIAYKITGSSFTATLGVTRKGHNPRRFNFAGHPTVSCVLK